MIGERKGWWVSGVARQRKFLTPSKLRERRTFAASVTTPYASMSSASRAMALTHHREKGTGTEWHVNFPNC